MADDKLKIVATLDDQISGPLSKVEGALKRTADNTKGAAVGMRKEWDAFKGVLGQTNSALSTFAAPLAALGLAGGGAALSLGALGGALRGFSQNTQQLDILSKQSGITVKTLQALENMGERVGISGQTMLGAADNFSRAATKLKRGWGEAMQELPAMNLDWLLKDLKSAGSVEEMMNKLFEGLPKISNLEARRRVLTMFFGTEEIDKIIQEYGTQAAKKLLEIRQSVADITPEARQAAKEFEDMVGRWDAAVGKAKVWALTPILKGLVTLFEDVEKHGLKGNEREQALRNQLSPFGGPEATPREKLEGRRTQVQSQLDLLEKGPRGADYQRKHDRMTEELKRVGDELQKLREQGATAQPSSFEAPGGMGGLIQKAAFGSSALGAPRGFGGGGIYGGPGRGSGGGYGGGSGGGGSGAPSDVPAAPLIGDRARPRPFGSRPAVPEGRGALPSEPPTGYSGNDGRRAARSGMTAGGRQNVASWMEFFRKPVSEGGMGYTEEQARGQIAMMQGESGLNLNPAAEGDHDRNRVPHAFGTVQWSDAKGNDRFPRLKALAAEMGKDWRDRGVQQEMYRREMLGRYRRAYDRIRNAQSGEQSLWTGITDYENPREHGKAYAIRQPFLNRLRRDAANPPPPLADKSGALTPPTGPDGDLFPNGAPRVLKPNSMTDAPGLTADEAARRREAFKNGGRRPDVLADPNDERRQGDKPFYSEEDDRRAARDLGIALRDRRRRAEAQPSSDGWKDPPPKPTPQKDAGAKLMDRFYGRGAAGGGPAMQMPGAQAGGKGTLHIKLSGAPSGTKVDHDMDGLFRGVTVSRHRASQMDTL